MYSFDVFDNLEIARPLVEVTPSVVGLLTLLFVLRFRRDYSMPDQMANVTAFLVGEYLDRKVSLSSAHITEIRMPTDSETMSDASSVYEGADVDLKELRNAANLFIKRSSLLEFVKIATDDTKSWQNRLAYELSIALERLGVAVFSGAVPISFVLAICGDQIVSDWGIAKTLVSKIRSRPDAPTSPNHYAKDVVPYLRRHGEWLAIVSAIWLLQEWNAPTVGQVFPNLRLNDLKHEEHKFRNQDQLLMAPIAVRDVDKIVRYSKWRRLTDL